MKLKQISVFLENKKGHLSHVLETLSKAKINIRALAMSDTSEFGKLRVIVNEPARAKAALEKHNFRVGENSVIAVGVSDTPSGLAEVIGILNKADLNVEYLYAFVEKSGDNAVIVLKTENVDEGIKVLVEARIPMLRANDICRI